MNIETSRGHAKIWSSNVDLNLMYLNACVSCPMLWFRIKTCPISSISRIFLLEYSATAFSSSSHGKSALFLLVSSNFNKLAWWTCYLFLSWPALPAVRLSSRINITCEYTNFDKKYASKVKRVPPMALWSMNKVTPLVATFYILMKSDKLFCLSLWHFDKL